MQEIVPTIDEFNKELETGLSKASILNNTNFT